MDEALTRTERADVAMLTGAEAEDILRAALAVEGAELSTWRVHTVHHRPGAGVTVGYTVRAGDGAREDYLCATTARLRVPAGPGLVRLESDETVIHVWRHPADPELPALAVACAADQLTDRLSLPTRPEIDLLAYRPLRRAVLRVRGEQVPGGEVYVKVVRPRVYADFVARHRMLTEAGVAAPRVLHAEDEGLVVLASGQGASLANLLSAGLDDREARLVLDDVVATLDQLPDGVLELPRRQAWAERAGHYGHAASVVLPEHSERIARLAEGIEAAVARTDPGPVVPTHGDLYEANLLMTDLRVSAVLDVDAVGPGHRVDDLACLLAHVSVLPHLAPQAYPAVPQTLAVWTARCEELVDPHALRARAAGVVLSLVAGAKRGGGQEWRRDAEGRLAEAERWLRAVGR